METVKHYSASNSSNSNSCELADSSYERDRRVQNFAQESKPDIPCVPSRSIMCSVTHSGVRSFQQRQSDSGSDAEADADADVDDDDERSLKLDVGGNSLRNATQTALPTQYGNWKKRAVLRSAIAETEAELETEGEVEIEVEAGSDAHGVRHMSAASAYPNGTSQSQSHSQMQAASQLQMQSAQPQQSFGGAEGHETAVVRRHRRKPPPGVRLTCRVCGDDACGYNFDALTCHSCKLFFRRNAYRTLTCPFSGTCQMDKRSRKFCASCRLRKCFAVGMLRELIKLRYVQKNYHHRSPSGPGGFDNNTRHQQGKGAEPPTMAVNEDSRPNSRFTPPDTPESAAEAEGEDEQPAQAAASVFEMFRAAAAAADAAGPSQSLALSQMPNGPFERPRALSFGSPTQTQAQRHGFSQYSSAPDSEKMLSSDGATSAKRARLSVDSQPLTPFAVPEGAAMSSQQQHLALSVIGALQNMIHAGAPSDSNAHRSAMLMQSQSLMAGAGSAAGTSQMDAMRQNFAPSFASAFARVQAPSAFAYNQFDDFGSPPSIAASVHSCSTASCGCSASIMSPSTIASRRPSVAMRTRSVLSEYEYDTMLLQCHSFWQSLTLSMIDSDIFAHMGDKSTLSQQLVCGPTTVNLQVRGANYVFTYFELGVRRAISALRLINDFTEVSAELQMKLLKTALLSVLNVISFCVYDAAAHQWTVKLTRQQSRTFSPSDAAQCFEVNSCADVVDYFARLGVFHSELRNKFADDHVPIVSMALIHLFEPSRFASESPALAAQLSRLQHKHVSFLRKYITRHYKTAGSNHTSSVPRSSSGGDEIRGLASLAADSNNSSRSTSQSNGAESNGSNGTDDRSRQKVPTAASDDESRARSLFHFCIDQLNSTVRGLEVFAQRVSNQLVVPNSTNAESECN